MVEYMVIVGAIALTALAGFSVFGEKVREVIGWEADCVRSLDPGCSGATGYPTATGGPGGTGGTGDFHGDIFVGTQGDSEEYDRYRDSLPPVTEEVTQTVTSMVSGDPGTEAGVAQVIDFVSRLPPADINMLYREGVVFVVQSPLRHPVTGQPLGPTPGGGPAVGAYYHDHRTIILSVDSNGHIVNGGSGNTIVHEVGHALDDLRGDSFWGGDAWESESPEFIAAWTKDVDALPTSDGPLRREYAREEVGGLDEAYADAYVMYLHETRSGGNDLSYNFPNLFEYFRSRDPDGPPPRR